MLNQKFTIMKKLIFLVCLLVGVGMSVNVMAQNTGIAPYVGSVHKYSVTDNTGSTYVWSLYVGGLSTSAGATDYSWSTDASLSSAYTGTSLDTPEIYIKWLSPSSGKTYYLKIEETGTLTGCTNVVVLKIEPTNAFDLTVDNVSSGTTPGTDPNNEAAICWTPSTPTVSLDGSGNVTYALNGSGNLKFRVNAAGLTNNNNWSFSYTISVTTSNATLSTPTGITDEAGNTPTLTSSGNGTATLTGTITVAGATTATDNDYMYFTVPVTSTEASNGSNITTVTIAISNASHAGASETTSNNNGSTGTVSRPDNDATITGGTAL